jgi:CubicO group peptidase (beta-lactamase class C family)
LGVLRCGASRLPGANRDDQKDAGMEEIGSLIDRAAGSGGLAGVAAAVVRPGQPPTMQCIGDADVSTARPVDPDTVFRIPSVTKTMTAIGLMQLHERADSSWTTPSTAT